MTPEHLVARARQHLGRSLAPNWWAVVAVIWSGQAFFHHHQRRVGVGVMAHHDEARPLRLAIVMASPGFPSGSGPAGAVAADRYNQRTVMIIPDRCGRNVARAGGAGVEAGSLASSASSPRCWLLSVTSRR